MFKPVWLLCVCITQLVFSLESPEVKLIQGQLKGTVLKTRKGRDISAFLGIPYASPPIGPLRFKSPQPAAAWEGVRDATKFGNKCIQQGNIRTKGAVVGSEDCLYLNVYTPE